jgi:hypothetical protein
VWHKIVQTPELLAEVLPAAHHLSRRPLRIADHGTSELTDLVDNRPGVRREAFTEARYRSPRETKAELGQAQSDCFLGKACVLAATPYFRRVETIRE